MTGQNLKLTLWESRLAQVQGFVLDLTYTVEMHSGPKKETYFQV